MKLIIDSLGHKDGDKSRHSLRFTDVMRSNNADANFNEAVVASGA